MAPPKFLALLIVAALLAACVPRAVAQPFATGLTQPRGMAFDASGDLLVAEAGAASGGASSGRVIRIGPSGAQSVAADGLPFTRLPDHGDVGAADIATLGGSIFVVTGEGHAALSRSVLRVLPDRSVQPIASLLNFATAGMPRDLIGSGLVASNPSAIAAAPDGSALYVADGASGRVLRVGLDGTIQLFAELPGMPPLAGLAFGPDGRLFFADFSRLPHAPRQRHDLGCRPIGQAGAGCGRADNADRRCFRQYGDDVRAGV
jgi:hypothetical protein